VDLRPSNYSRARADYICKVCSSLRFFFIADDQLKAVYFPSQYAAMGGSPWPKITDFQFGQITTVD